MEFIQTLDELEALYGSVSEGARRNGSDYLTPRHTKLISES